MPRPLRSTFPYGFWHLTSRGVARGALPPTVEGGYEGNVTVMTTGGGERVPVKGRFR